MSGRALGEIKVRPIINSQVFNELVEVGGLDFAQELLTDFFKQAAEKLPEMNVSVAVVSLFCYDSN